MFACQPVDVIATGSVNRCGSTTDRSTTPLTDIRAERSDTMPHRPKPPSLSRRFLTMTRELLGRTARLLRAGNRAERLQRLPEQSRRDADLYSMRGGL